MNIEPLESRIAPAAVISLADLDGTNGVRIDGTNPFDQIGAILAVAGDVNGDGFDDIILGAPSATAGGDVSAGQIYVLFGKAAGFTANLTVSALDGANGFRLDGIDPGDDAGISVNGAGDVNGDGFDDIIIGAWKADPGGRLSAGEVYVVFGKADWSATPSLPLEALDGTNGFRLDGATASDYAGYAVNGAGDVNGDGFADVVIGAPGGNAYAGQTFVVFGKGDWSATPSVNLGALNGTTGFRLDGIVAKDSSGYSVSGSIDINGDGFDDLIVSASYADPGGKTDAGETYVIFGKLDWSATPVLALSALNGTNGFRVPGLDPQDYSGLSVSGAGDVNGDGFDDLVIGASYGDPGGKNLAGESYVIFGKANWSATPSFDLATLDGTNGFRLDGIDPLDRAGQYVSGAGDVNHDGFDDFLVGALRADPDGRESAGESYVVFGKAGGFGASLALSSLDGTNGFRIQGIDADDRAGAVAGGGDVNGDGFDDILVGAYRAKPGGIDHAGEAYVIFGAAGGGPGPDPGQVTISKNGRSAFFTDVDGDKVTVKTTKGKFTQAMFDLRLEGLGAQLESVTLTEPTFATTKLSFKAKPQKLEGAAVKSGDKMVNVGAIDAAGVDLGKVKLKGDLGQIDAGSGDNARPALKSLSVVSLGALGSGTQAATTIEPLHSHFAGVVGSIKIKADLGRADIAACTAITISGPLDPANAKAAVALKKLTVGGSVVNAQILAGYDDALTGLNPDAGIGKVIVNGNWSASSLVAGILDATADGFGQNDIVIPEPVTDDILSRIASLTIKGSGTGSANANDYFGITAQEIGQVKIGPTRIPLSNDPATPDNLLLDETNQDFRLVEVVA